MTNYHNYILIFLFLVIGCNTTTKESNKRLEFNVQSCQENDLNNRDSNQTWACFVTSKNSDSLLNFYSNNSIKIDNSGDLINGLKDIVDYHMKYNLNIDSINAIKRIAANENKTYDYEIGTFETKNNGVFKHLIIWNLEDPETRELEFIAKSKKSIPLDSKINERREEWITLCNKHNAKELVTKLYAVNSIYFNHKPAIIGIDSISKEYEYMNDPNYKLSLKPITIEMVTENLAFEIGQCSGTYNGKYVIVWKKDKVGEWKILLDSNI